MRAMRSGRAGFTLVEVMVAMVIMAVGLFAVINLQLISIRGSSAAEEAVVASRMAQSVVEEMRAQSLGWLDNQGAAVGWDAVFVDGGSVGTEIEFTGSPPAYPGGTLGTADLRAVRHYLGQEIAAASDPSGAPLIDQFGRTGPGAIYRLHYIAHEMPLLPAEPLTGVPTQVRLIRMSVIVSWDSKDFGTRDYNWSEWWEDGDNFWKRNMVVATFFLTRHRNW
ncbi:MAG: type IV pilus modification protein PilV [Deltaproteobacteria bacterium]|nr:type IV pilus modification protein PilV [Deltaproteobacteria bacterium]